MYMASRTTVFQNSSILDISFVDLKSGLCWYVSVLLRQISLADSKWQETRPP